MNNRPHALMLVLALPLAACSDRTAPDGDAEYTLDVDVDVNPDVMLSSYGTFDIIHPDEQVDDPPAYSFDEIEAQLDEAITRELGGKGLTRDTESPDLLINPLVKVAEVTDRHSFYDAYYGWYWGYNHLWTVAYEISRGSLVLDVVDPGAPEDPDDDMLVYRGVAWGLMAEDAEIIKLELRNAVQAIFEDWPDVTAD